MRTALPGSSTRWSSLSLLRPRGHPPQHRHPHQPLCSSRSLLTLAIETSCDDTCVAILSKSGGAARLLFNKKVTSDNRAFGGVHPVTALKSHDTRLAALVQEALQSLPECSSGGDDAVLVGARGQDALSIRDARGVVHRRRRPDFVAATRGPGMASPLATGLNTAKGLAVAWGVPLVGVHHMQAHALTPRLVSALGQPWPAASGSQEPAGAAASPSFPFLTLLVSGGHTLLVLSTALTSHSILAAAHNIAVGDMIDKCAREVLPRSVAASSQDVMYGAQLEAFAFPAAEPDRGYEYDPPARRADELRTFDSGLGWTLGVPLGESRAMSFNFSGLNGQVIRLMEARPDMGEEERRVLARATMKLAFEHLASRVVFALQDLRKGGLRATTDGLGTLAGGERMVKTLVVSGGVASNRFLMHLLRSVLDVRGFRDVEIIAPPPALCTDNAAMIAWAGMEMWEAGWQSSLDILVKNKWSMDPEGNEGGILGLGGWVRRDEAASAEA